MATTSNKPVDWAVLEQAYAEGASDVEIARELGITISKFFTLYEQNSAFAEFVDSGRTLAQAWWYHQSRKGLWNKAFNTSLYNFVMKNRYGWADKVEASDTTDKDPANLDHAKAQLAIVMKRLATTQPDLFKGTNLYVEPEPKATDD